MEKVSPSFKSIKKRWNNSRTLEIEYILSIERSRSGDLRFSWRWYNIWKSTMRRIVKFLQSLEMKQLPAWVSIEVQIWRVPNKTEFLRKSESLLNKSLLISSIQSYLGPTWFFIWEQNVEICEVLNEKQSQEEVVSTNSISDQTKPTFSCTVYLPGFLIYVKEDQL